MKNYILTTLLGGLVLWTGCTNEELTQSTTSGQPYVLKVRIEKAQADTRTQVDEDGNVTWTEGDQIGVFVEGETASVPFTYSGMTGNVASFTGTLPEGGELTAAYYPYQEEAKLEENTLRVVLPEENEYTGYSNGPMLGLPDGEGGLYFRHLCGLLAVTIDQIPEGAVKLKLESPDNDLKGNFGVKDITVEEAILEKWNLYSSQDVTYRFPADWVGQSKTFYLPIPPADYTMRDGIKISLKDADGNTLWYKNFKAIIGRGSMLDMPEITDTKPVIVITSHKNEYTFSGHKSYTTITLKGYMDNFYRLDSASVSLKNMNRHADYNLRTGYLFGKRNEFEMTVDVYPGTNYYTIGWKGESTGYREIKDTNTFIINYEEKPVIAEIVDLGLSVPWASHNVGASKNSEYGCLYIWGDGSGTDLRHEDKYDAFMEDGITNISGNPAYDVATSKWGDQWRMPTVAEFEELNEMCEQTPETVDGITGIRFIGPNGNSIFLPAAGYYYGYHDLRSEGTMCRYWTGGEYADIFGSRYSEIAAYIGDLENFKDKGRIGMTYWTFGCSVRPVYGNP